MKDPLETFSFFPLCVSKTWFPGEPVVRFHMESSLPSEKKSKAIWNVLCVSRQWQGHSRINHIGSITWQVIFIIWVQPHLYRLLSPGYHCLGCCWLDKSQNSFKGLLWRLVRSGSREVGWTCTWAWRMVGWGHSPGPVTVRADDAAAAPSLQVWCFTGSKCHGLCDKVNFPTWVCWV